MKMKWITSVGLLALGLLASQEAGAFYNPSTGRWLSRDPIVEVGFERTLRPVPLRFANSGDEEGKISPVEAASTALVGNAPVHSIDVLGLFGLNGRTVLVNKCEIVILYGHGSTRSTYKWRLSKSGCAAGAAVVCWNSRNIQGLDQNLWSQGADLDEPIIWKDMPANPDRSEPGVPRSNLGDIIAPQVLDYVIKNAVNNSQELCRNAKCCCPAVTVRFVKIEKDGTANPDPKGKPGNDGVPVMPSYRLNCKTRVPTFL